MRSLLYVSLVVLFVVVPSYGAPTIRMLDDRTPAYSMEILEDGWAGYSAGDTLSTFCVEKNEYFTPGRAYYAVLNDAAVAGGVSGGNPDPLDARSAYLYTQFLAGTSGFSDEIGIQNAIWYIEGEIGTSNGYVTMAETAIADGSWSGIGDIRVANLYQNYDGQTYSGFAQDQLVSIHPVPVPGALLLAGMGTVLVGRLRRRSR